MNFLKVYIFYQILCFIFKNYPNFKLYKIFLIILYIVCLCHKIQLVLNVMYITPHLHVVKDL
jgi:hypothetical protein